MSVLRQWDSGWYLTVAARGYPSSLPIGALSSQSWRYDLAFFPLLPLLIHGLRSLTGLDLTLAGVVVSLLTSTLAVIATYSLARRLCGHDVGLRTATLLAFFPSAFVFSMVYTEGLFIACVAFCLLMLVDRRWLWAGMAGAVGTATRPNGIALIVCCLWVGVLEARRSRTVRPLLAPLIAPAGVAGYSLYLWAHTGDPLIWQKASAQGFSERIDGGISTWRGLHNFLTSPISDFNRTAASLSVVFIVVTVVLLIQWRPPSVLLVCVIALLGPVLLKSGFGATARYTMTAVPLLIAATRRLPAGAFAAVCGTSALLMTIIGLAALSTLLYTP